MSQNKIGVSRKMSIEYPYKQLPCQTQGGFLQTALSAVTRRSRSCSSPVLLRRVTPDRVLAFSGISLIWRGTPGDFRWSFMMGASRSEIVLVLFLCPPLTAQFHLGVKAGVPFTEITETIG